MTSTVPSPERNLHARSLLTTDQSRKPFGSFGNGSGLTNESSRPGNGTTFGSGFTNTSAGWNGGIWSNSAIGSGIKSGSTDSGRVLGNYNTCGSFKNRHADCSEGDISNLAPTNHEAITGSGSLLSSSESDSFIGRHTTPWKTVEDPSPGLTKVHSNHSNSSTMHRQNSNQLASQGFSDNHSAHSSYYSVPSASVSSSSKQTQSKFLDPTSSSFVASAMLNSARLGRTSRNNSDEETRPAVKSIAFGEMEGGHSIQPGRPNYYTNFSGQNSSAASRSGSMPPSRHDALQPSSRFVDDTPRQQNVHLGPTPFHRPNHSVQSAMYPSNGGSISQKYNAQPNSDIGSLAGGLDKLSLAKGNHPMYAVQDRDSQQLNAEYADFEYARPTNGNNSNEMWPMDDTGYPGNQAFSSEGLLHETMPLHDQPYRNNSYGPSYSHSPSNSEARRSQHSPYYSSAGTPSSYQQRAPSRGSFNGVVVPGQAALLDRKLRGLQQEQQGYPPTHPNPLQYRPPMPQHYDYHPQHALRMNPLAAYYPMPPMPNILNPPIPRGPARDQDIGQHLRSALLEEFRSNSKTNKRYELKVWI